MNKKIASRLRKLASDHSSLFGEEIMKLLADAAEALEAQTKSEAATPTKRGRDGVRDGEEIIWASGAEARYGISKPTRWRWERSGKLPPRDVHLGAGAGEKSGWRKATLDNWEKQ